MRSGRDISIPFSGFAGWAIFIGVWFVLTETGLLDPLFVASPVSTARALAREIMNGTLLYAAMVTTGLALSGFVIGVLIGVPMGLAMGGIPIFRRVFGSLIDGFRSIPSTALFPLFLLGFGVGSASKIAIACFVSSLAVCIYTAAAVPDHWSTRRFLLRLHGATRISKFIDGLFFPSLSGVVGGIRTAISMALVGTIANEMIVGTDIGLGRYIYNSQMTFRIPEMYASIVVAGMIGIALNRGLVGIISRLVKWRQFDEVY